MKRARFCRQSAPRLRLNFEMYHLGPAKAARWLCFGLLALIFIPSVRATDGAPAWVSRYNGPANNTDDAAALALDGADNVYVTGSSFAGESNPGYTTIKYSAAGIPLWTNFFYVTNTFIYPRGIAVDSGGNPVVTGVSFGNGPDNYITIRYSSAGTPLWTNRFYGVGNIYDTMAAAVDTSSNVYVGGSSIASVETDFATIKYSAAGVALWTNRYNGPDNSYDSVQSMVVAGSSNVYVTGYVSGIGSGLDFGTVKYSSAGVALWTNLYNGTGNSDDFVKSIAVDGNGNAYVAGYSTGTNGHYDCVTIKYANTGAPLWTNRFKGVANSGASAKAVVVDGGGNAYVAGGALINGQSDYSTIKYSSAGVPLWTNYFDYQGTGNFAQALALDGNGNAYITGYSIGSEANYDYATVKYSSAGAAVWTNIFNGEGNSGDVAVAMAADTGGNVFVTGYSFGSSSFDDFVTIKYAGSPPNDNFSNAQPLAGTNITFSGSNLNAKGEAGEPPPLLLSIPNETNSVWFQWTAPAAGGAVIEIQSIGDFNTPMLTVFTNNTLATLGRVAASSSSFNRARVAFTAVSNLTYKIVVGGSFQGNAIANQGDFTGTLIETPVPANDSFANRLVISNLSYARTGSFLGSSREAGEPTNSAAYPQTLWWSWSAPTNLGVTNIPVRLMASSINWMPAIGVYTGSVVSVLSNIPVSVRTNAFTNANVNFSATRIATFNAKPGTTYHISVADYGGDPDGNVISSRFGNYSFRFNAGGLTLKATNFMASLDANATIDPYYHPYSYTGTVIVANSGSATSRPLRLRTFSASGFGAQGIDPGSTTVIQTNYSTNTIGSLSPGQIVSVTVKGVIPSAGIQPDEINGNTQLISRLGDGYGVFSLLEEQPITNVWFTVDHLLVGFADWPDLNGFIQNDNNGRGAGPGGGVVRQDPDFTGLAGFNELLSVAIQGTLTVPEGSSMNYTGKTVFVNQSNGVATVHNYTNAVWSSSLFTITNGAFAAGNVTSNTTVTLTVVYPYNSFLYSSSTNIIITDLVVDGVSPVNTIATPTAGQRWSNAIFTVTGTASDNVKVTNVSYALNNSAWTTAATANSWTNWSATVTLKPGTNSILAYAVDSTGNRSSTNSVTFQFVVTNQLLIRTLGGLGTISPNYSNALLEVGRNYSVTSSPAAGFTFSNWMVATNWVGGTKVLNTNLTFMMSSNLTLQANILDLTLPSVTIVTPVANQKMTNALAQVTGTASDNWQVTGVWYQLNTGTWNLAPTANNWTNWSTTLTLITGTNTIKAYALDLGGNYSTTSQVSFLSSNTFNLQLAFNTNKPLATNGLRFQLLLSSNLNGRIEYSTNLVNWTTFTNFTGTNTTLNFRDGAATNAIRRYYRAVIP